MTQKQSRVHRLVRGLGASVTAIAVATVGLMGAPAARAADPAPAPADPVIVTADALPTWQINGVVWSQAIVGNTVYVAGSFTRARPPGVAAGGAGEVVADNLFAYDVTTGNRVATFNHSLNAQALVIKASPDGSRVYVGGDFTTVNGVARGHVAAFSTSTHALVTTWAPNVGGQVRGFGITPTTVYVGGNFPSANGVTRTRLAAFSTSNGAMTSWAPTADGGYVWTMTMSPDLTKVIPGGSFTTLSGVPAYGMGAINAATGAILPWQATSTIRDAGSNAAITALKHDGTQIIGSGYSFGGGGEFEGTFGLNPADGSINYVNDCLGDTYDVAAAGEVLYAVSHAHDCSAVDDFPDTNPRVRWQKATAQFNYGTNVTTKTSAYGWDKRGYLYGRMLHWWPDLAFGTYTSSRQAAWSVATVGEYVVMGGEFPRVNGASQQGLTRMRKPAAAPKLRGPRYTTQPATPTPTTNAASLTAGTARVSWGTAWDQDNKNLKYEVLRDNTTWVHTTTSDSSFWRLPRLGFVDSGLAPGSTHRYQVRITDPHGNTLWSPVSNTVTVTSGTQSPYAARVTADGAEHFWRIGEPSGTSGSDYAGFDDLTFAGTYTRGVAGAIAGDPDKASRFDGSSGFAVNSAPIRGPDVFTQEAWIRTTSTTGGKIVGFGDRNSGLSGSYDRHLYMDAQGRVWFGVYKAATYTVNTTGSLNDGKWHHVVGTLDPSGVTLYVDGRLVGRNAGTTTGQAYDGYWRVGGDKSWSGNPYFNGDIDDVAIYPTALPAATVQNHFLAGTGTLPNQAPTAAFSASPSNLAVAVNASASSDTDGSITSYSWNWGDGTPAGSGVSTNHTYALAGTYTITLTVKDDDGATDTEAKQVTVTAPSPNLAPTAAFTHTESGLAVAVNGSTSSDTDGSIASYAWNWGDGTPAGLGVSTNHSYAAAGSYAVTLTVTDDDGATDTQTETVTVAAPAFYAQDAFERTVANGWGTANTGGAWTISGTVDRWSVNGGIGKVSLNAGNGYTAYLGGVSNTNTEMTAVVTSDKAPTGGGQYLSVIGRRVSATADYRAKVRFAADGAVSMWLMRNASGTETTLSSVTVAGLSFAANERMNVRLQVTGTSPTTARAKIWKVGAPEPTAWTLTSTDSTAGYQVAGSAGIYTYVSGSVTNGPVVIGVDDVWIGPARP